ncbi:MAG: hypothetical protein IGR92_17895 [Leptolyngbyaceae cyanobacterium T60_A2020_046]|nr:hypothetical protein [Leptolyngbyaceae cyanobacterium T60_A2020_046]
MKLKKWALLPLFAGVAVLGAACGGGEPTEPVPEDTVPVEPTDPGADPLVPEPGTEPMQDPEPVDPTAPGADPSAPPEGAPEGQ